MLEIGVEGGIHEERVYGACGNRADFDGPAKQGSIIASSILDKDSTVAGQGESETQKHDLTRELSVLDATQLRSDEEATHGSCEEHIVEFLELYTSRGTLNAAMSGATGLKITINLRMTTSPKGRLV